MKQTFAFSLFVPASPHISESKRDGIPEFGFPGVSCAWEGQGVLRVPQSLCCSGEDDAKGPRHFH